MLKCCTLVSFHFEKKREILWQQEHDYIASPWPVHFLSLSKYVADDIFHINDNIVQSETGYS